MRETVLKQEPRRSASEYSKTSERGTLYMTRDTCSACVGLTHMIISFTSADCCVQVDFHTPAIITKGSPHHGSVCAVQHTSDGGLVTCSEVR